MIRGPILSMGMHPMQRNIFSTTSTPCIDFENVQPSKPLWWRSSDLARSYYLVQFLGRV